MVAQNQFRFMKLTFIFNKTTWNKKIYLLEFTFT